MKKLLVLAGDGIGPEVTGEARPVIEWIATNRRLDIEISEALFGGASYDRHCVFITEQTMAAARDADAILCGAEGGPQWDDAKSGRAPEERGGLSRLRRGLDLYANLRPIKPCAALTDA